MNQNLRENKTNFHMKGFALGLALKQKAKCNSEIASSPGRMLSLWKLFCSFDHHAQFLHGSLRKVLPHVQIYSKALRNANFDSKNKSTRGLQTFWIKINRFNSLNCVSKFTLHETYKLRGSTKRDDILPFSTTLSSFFEAWNANNNNDNNNNSRL